MSQILEIAKRHLSSHFRPSGGSNYLTKCPFHKGGEEKTASFSFNSSTGLWHCFSCHEGGGLKKLLSLLGVPKSRIDSETASVEPTLKKNWELYKLGQKHFFERKDPFKADYILEEAILGVFDFAPVQLVEAGFDQLLLKQMEVGWDRWNNRVTYPLRDMYGNLAGFSGGAGLLGQWPKYKVYQGSRYGEGKAWIKGDFQPWFDKRYPGYRCENHDFLWNFHKVFPKLSDLSDSGDTVYVVEGFKACIWMLQSGFENTVALMGSYISERQQRMLHLVGCRVALFLDNDAPGRKAVLNVANLLWLPLYGRIDVVQYPAVDVRASIEENDKTQPDDYEPEAIRCLVKNKVTFIEHYQQMRRAGLWH